MYVKRHEQFEIGRGAILNKIYYYYRLLWLFILHRYQQMTKVWYLRFKP